MHRNVVDVHLFVVHVKDDDVAEGYAPLLPYIGFSVIVAVDVLQPRDVASLGDVLVARFKRPIVDT